MSQNEPLEDIVALNLTNCIGSIVYERLRNYFGSSDKIISASKDKLEKIEGVGQSIAQAIVNIRNNPKKVKREFEMAKKLGVELIPYYSDRYPPQLKNIPSFPLMLYVKGKIENSLCLAIVGTRRATSYGKKQAEIFAKNLADLGICIVSGLARGIDTCAHQGALKSPNGKTIAIVGCGLNTVYPSENRKLFYEICEKGAVISEFSFDTPPNASNFPRRNRIISGLSEGVIVVQAGEKSGAIITAGMALEQGRDVFAIPGNIDNPQSIGCNNLIKQGAKLVDCLEDILQEIPSYKIK